MNRRTRSIAGLCALLALIFSFTEAVWASTCAMPMAGGRAVAGGAMEEVPTGAHCMGHRGGESEPGDPGEPCPFNSAAAAQACAGVASFPAGSAVLPAIAANAVARHIGLETRPSLLLGASLFRPPRP